MAKLIYSTSMSLDSYAADETGNFDWTAPDEEVFTLINERERRIGTYLFGRRTYETMAVWETLDTAGLPSVVADYASIWREVEKIVFSSALEAPVSEKTRIEREFDPEAVRAMKRDATRDLSVGGPTLAAQAIASGLVDAINIFVDPIIVGGGLRALLPGLRVGLELLEERRFSNGFVYLRYLTRP
jgi:dihydrofolate reductase